jgi:hypothetical protein
VIEEAADALIHGTWVRQAFEPWIEEPAEFEDSGKTVIDGREWRARLARPAPSEIEKDSTA